MNKTKLIEKIKEQLKSIISNEEVKFAEVKAGDLMISSPDEELVVGSEVYTIDQDGNNIPLTDGEYTLDSGVKIAVVNGKIEAIVSTESPEAETEIEIEAETKDTGEEKMPEEEVKVEEEAGEEPSKEEEMKKLMERVAKCEEQIAEMAKEKTAMEQKLSAISNEPATTAISVEPAEFNSVENKKESIGAVDVIAIREKVRKNRV